MAVLRDPLELARRLERTGMSRDAAEGMVEALRDAFDDRMVATKKDVTDLKTELRIEIATLKGDLKTDIANGRTSIVKWVAGLLLGQVALIIGVMEFLRRMFP
jgi:hypothetical protein